MSELNLTKLACVNAAQKIVYLAHPRTASHATVRALSGQAGFSGNPQHHHTGLSNPVPDEWMVLTTVRNHFDALVSWYEGRYAHSRPFNLSFIRFLLARHPYYFPAPTCMWGLHLPYATNVVHWESLEGELNAALALRDLGPVRVSRQNVTERREGRAYQDYFDPPSRHYVEDRFALEMAKLGYTWEEDGEDD